MKHIYITLIIIFSSFVLNAQEVFFLHAVKVHEDRVESFEKIQKNYARELAQDAKNEGILKDWVLFKPVQFMGESTEQEYNYVWVHIFKDVKQMVNRTTWWDKSKEKFGIEPSILFREDLEKSGYWYWKTEKQIETGNLGKYIIFNWGTPTDVNAAVSIADEISETFRPRMKTIGMTEWGVATKIMPQGGDNSTIFFWDAYDTFEGTVKHLMNDAILKDVDAKMFQKFFELLPNGWDNRMIFEPVTGTN